MTNPKTKITLSLVIPAYNEEKYIGDCLSHALKHGAHYFSEIIVIDNASTDGTKTVAQKYPGVRVVDEPSKGLTKARERGFQEATGNVICYIDADTRMPDGWCEKIIQEFSTHPNTVCVSGPYIYYDVSKAEQFLTKLYWTIIGFPMYFIVGYMATGGNFAIKKETLTKMGGFDTSIAFYGEDTDIAKRASRYGKVIFKSAFSMYTSGRRFDGQGFWKTGVLYMLNFCSEVIFSKPLNNEYKDIR